MDRNFAPNDPSVNKNMRSMITPLRLAMALIAMLLAARLIWRLLTAS